MSFGIHVNRYGPDTTVENAINAGFNAGVSFVGSASNDGVSTLQYPAALPNVISVAATDSSDRIASFSNYGPWVDVAAPGVNIRTTTVGENGYATVSGTSFSAPLVSSFIGLLLTVNPEYNPSEIKTLVENSGDKISSELYIGTRLNGLNLLTWSLENPFAAIKSPHPLYVAKPGSRIQFFGTAYGEEYELEYKESSGSNWEVISQGEGVVNGDLGFWNTGGLPSGNYVVRLTAYLGESSDSFYSTLILDEDLVKGWPVIVEGTPGASPSFEFFDGPPLEPTLPNSSADKSTWFDSSKSVAANRKTRRQKIVVPHYTGLFTEGAGKLSVFNFDGSLVQGWPKTFPGSGREIAWAPAIGRVEGLKSIVTGQSYSYRVSGFHLDGSLIEGWPLLMPAFGNPPGSQGYYTSDASPVIADLNNDGNGEIINLGTFPSASNPQQKLFVFDSNTGEIIWEFNSGNPNNRAIPAIGDLNNDGSKEVVFKVFCHTYVLDKRGNRISSFYTSVCNIVLPVIADINNDGFKEVLIVNNGDRVTAYSIDGNVVRHFIAPGATQSQGLDYKGNIAIGNVDADHNLEIFARGLGKLFGWKSDGSLLNGFPIVIPGSSRSNSGSISIFDVDNDGISDVIVTQNNKIYAYKGSGELIGGWPKTVVGDIVTGFAANAIDQPSFTLDSGLGYMAVSTKAGYVYIWSFPSSQDSAVSWPTFRGNNNRDGCYNC